MDNRLARIAELMERDPAPDTPEGRELLALVDEQIEAEKGIMQPSSASGDSK